VPDISALERYNRGTALGGIRATAVARGLRMRSHRALKRHIINSATPTNRLLKYLAGMPGGIEDANRNAVIDGELACHGASKALLDSRALSCGVPKTVFQQPANRGPSHAAHNHAGPHVAETSQC
jgi:hypothetical protein